MRFFGPRYYLLHALSHLLIQAISLECGYRASSLPRAHLLLDAQQPVGASLIVTQAWVCRSHLGPRTTRLRAAEESPDFCYYRALKETE